MTNADLVWVIDQLKKRHPTTKIATLNNNIVVESKVVSVPYQQLLAEVNERTHYSYTEAEVDRLFTILLYVEQQAGLKVSYDR